MKIGDLVRWKDDSSTVSMPPGYHNWQDIGVIVDYFDIDKRKGKIAGTVARHIVDLNGKFMTEFMDGATHYLATFKNDTITIERA